MKNLYQLLALNPRPWLGIVYTVMKLPGMQLRYFVAGGCWCVFDSNLCSCCCLEFCAWGRERLKRFGMGWIEVYVHTLDENG